jgi:hypothetical protein
MTSHFSPPTSPLTIVTGASSNHFLPLQSLLWTIAKFEPAARVIVYDLGLTPDEHATLRDAPPFYLANWELRTFAFENYPPHFSLAENAGRMAFRPTVLAALAKDLSLVGRASSRAVPLAPLTSHLLWLDAGCQLREPLHAIRACIARDGVYSPCAPGSIEQCLHPTSYPSLGLPDQSTINYELSTILPLPIRDAGICGFDIPVAAVYDRRVLALLNRWAEIALDKNATAPENSTRHTHRQDAVFAVLLNQAARENNWTLETKRLRGLAIKQDALTLAETKFRIDTLGAPAPAPPKLRSEGESRRQISRPATSS